MLTKVFVMLVLIGAGVATVRAADQPLPLRVRNESLRNEIQNAADKGVRWLRSQQNTNGAWSNPDHPAVTALALTACLGEPSGAVRKNPPEFVKRGYEFLLSCVQPDGGIYRSGLQNYNTSLAVMALLAANDPKYDPIIRRARNFIIGQQNDFGEKGKIDDPLDGGIGYGGSRPHSDMSNTLMALEALYYSEHLARDEGKSELKELNWEAVLSFIQRCQNLPGHNHEPWASDDAANKGGFVYFPGNSMAGETNLASGKKALRSYGSISYAGMLSYIYANVKRDDPRVLAVYDWLKRNYTLDENPGLGLQGLFYYYHTMAKALTIYGGDELTLAGGRKVNWREDLAKKLLNLQDKDGFWANENNRWWEKDPVLATAYALIALEFVARGL
jgi:squalene-hopene/tetraprenyl-beta-curcumene cyclase